MSSNQTCDVNAFPSWESLPVPTNITVGGLSRRNDTLIAMQNCCSPNPVHSTGDNDCALWCEIPDDTTERKWVECTAQYVGSAHIVTWRSEGGMATMIHPTTMGVAIAALLISGLYAW